MGWAHLITVNSRYDPWSNWKLSRNFLVPLEMWTEEVVFLRMQKFFSARELKVPVGMWPERVDQCLPEDGLPTQARLLLPVPPYRCYKVMICGNSQVFPLERADLECWGKSFPLWLWPQFTDQDLRWVRTFSISSSESESRGKRDSKEKLLFQFDMGTIWYHSV